MRRVRLALSPEWSRTNFNTALALFSITGFVVRVAPLLRAGGPLTYPIDYDEGVYFSASALLFRGVFPYRDFVFVHPPGLLYALGSTATLSSAVGPAAAFAISRIVAAVIGAANIALAGRVAYRWAGPFAGLVAAGLYASYPEVAVVERGPYLEPVLNLLCLSMALFWLSSQSADRPLRTYAAGALCGAALAVKIWGAIWLAAALAAAPPDRRIAAAGRFLAVASLVALVLVAPLALLAPVDFITDALLFHLWRPPDGDISRSARLLEIWSSRHLVSSILAVVGLVLGVAKRDQRVGREFRLFAIAYVLSIAAFLAASAYWSQYNAHLAASESVLAGFGAGWLWQRVRTWLPMTVRTSMALLSVAALVFPSTRQIILQGRRAHSQGLVEFGDGLRVLVPPGDCVFAFEPAWGLLGGHLPPHRRERGPVVIDSYAAMLLAATRGGLRYPDATAAFRQRGAQDYIRGALSACDVVIVGWRGNWQLTEETKEWLRARFVRRDLSGIDVWVAVPRSDG